MDNSQPLNQKIAEVSVVIATLGGGTLKRTIECLNEGEYIPHEILICIPLGDAYKIKDIYAPNLKVVKTEFRGQVMQRIIGFQTSSQPLVLQLDDDLELDSACLRNLVEFMSGKSKVSVSPSLLDNVTGKPSSHMKKPNESSGVLYKFLFYVVNGSSGYQAGKISLSGVNMAYANDQTDPYEVEWIPGGCAMHFRENTINYNYYPFKGKAYSEDLFHSIILRRKGIKLYHCPSAICYLDNSSSKSDGILSLLNIFFSFARVMFHFAKFTKKNRLRLAVFFALNYIILFMNKVTRKH